MLHCCLQQSLTVQIIKNQLARAPSNRRKQCSYRQQMFPYLSTALVLSSLALCFAGASARMTEEAARPLTKLAC